MTDLELEKLMEARELPESDRDEVRDFLAFLSIRAEKEQLETALAEVRKRYRAAVEAASRTEGGRA